MQVRTNVALIGMPGAGKSTIGVLLAKRMGKSFVDTDLLIQAAEGRTLQQIVDQEGQMELREIEARTLLSLDCQNHVIATGGSAVYSDRAMRHLIDLSVIVYLHVRPEVLHQRLTNFATRGVARRPDQSFEDLYREREILYERYADRKVICGTRSQEALAEEIHRMLVDTGAFDVRP